MEQYTSCLSDFPYVFVHVGVSLSEIKSGWVVMAGQRDRKQSRRTSWTSCQCRNTMSDIPQQTVAVNNARTSCDAPPNTHALFLLM